MVKLANQEHLKEIMKLINDSIENMLNQGIDQWDNIYPNELVFEKDIEESELYIFERNDIIEGIIVLNQKPSSGYENINWSIKDGKPLIIHRLCVHPNFQKIGVAKKLMIFAENYGRNNSFSSIQLDAFSENERAISFYENAHYKKVGSINYRKGLFYIYEKSL